MAEKAKTLLAKIRFLEMLSLRDDLTTEDRRLATMLVSLWNEERGFAYPTQKQIAENLRRVPRTIRKTVRRLADRKLFKVSWPKGPGRGHATQYVPNFELVPDGPIYKLEKADPIESAFQEGGADDEAGHSGNVKADSIESSIPTADAKNEKGTSDQEKRTSEPKKGDPYACLPSEESSTEESYNRASADAASGDADRLPDMPVGQQLRLIEGWLNTSPEKLDPETLITRLCRILDELDDTDPRYRWADRLIDELSELDEPPNEPAKAESVVVDLAAVRQGNGTKADQPAELTDDEASQLLSRYILDNVHEDERATLWPAMFDGLDLFLNRLKIARPDDRQELCRAFISETYPSTENDMEADDG